MEIKDIMRKAVTIHHNATLKEVIGLMVEEKVNSIVIIDKQGKLVGSVDIVSLIKAIVPEYIGNRDNSISEFTNEEIFDEFIEDNKNKKVKYFMLKDPKIIHIDSSILTAAMITTEGRQTRISVVDDDNKPVGVITRHSIKKILAAKLGFKTK